ncbi:MAG: response regulator, partial [Deltaproteobacteria bacterium]
MRRILVVEDDDTMREGMVTILSAMGHEVLAARNGLEGRDRFAEAHGKRPIALVLTDLRMEGLDGMALLRHLRETAPETVVIMITAFGSIE